VLYLLLVLETGTGKPFNRAFIMITYHKQSLCPPKGNGDNNKSTDQ